MTVQIWTGQGFTDGAAVSTANSGGAAGDALTITLVSPGTAFAKTLNPPIAGYRWVELTNAGGTGERARAHHSLTSMVYNRRWYFQFPTNPGATTMPFTWLTPGSFSIAAQIGFVFTGGLSKLRLLDTASATLCDWGVINFGTATNCTYMLDTSLTSVGAASGIWETRLYDSTGAEVTPASGSRTGNTANFGTTGFERHNYGPASNAVPVVIRITGLKTNDGPAALQGPAGANIAPVATIMARPNPQEPGTVTVTGTVTDSDGTVSSVAVTIVSGPDNPTVSVSPTGLNSASCSVSATFAAQAGASYVVRLSGVDNNGAASNNSDVIIDTYSTGAIKVRSEITTTGAATLVGAADGVTAMNDGSTASYRETIAAPSAAPYRVSLQAIRPGVGIDVNPDVLLVGVTPVSCACKLYKEDNTTQVGTTQTITVPSGAPVPTVTWSAATLASAGLTTAVSLRELRFHMEFTQ